MYKKLTPLHLTLLLTIFFVSTTYSHLELKSNSIRAALRLQQAVPQVRWQQIVEHSSSHRTMTMLNNTLPKHIPPTALRPPELL